MKLRLLDFNCFDSNQFNTYENVKEEEEDEEEEEEEEICDSLSNKKMFIIQMFGLLQCGESVCIFVRDFKPHFYVKIENKTADFFSFFMNALRNKLTSYGVKRASELIHDKCTIVKKQKLYGFDNSTLNDFIYLEFETMACFNIVKSFWFDSKTKKLFANGFYNTYIYESQIPPLLRFFHIHNISPTGWISVEECDILTTTTKRTSCVYEFIIQNSSSITPLNSCNEIARYKICSFDIEASSSHGDFPIPVKNYKKLSINVIDYFEKNKMSDPISVKDHLWNILKRAFGFFEDVTGFDEIERIYTKYKMDKSKLHSIMDKMVTEVYNNGGNDGGLCIEARQIYTYFSHNNLDIIQNDDDDDDDHDNEYVRMANKLTPHKYDDHKTMGFLNILCSTCKLARENKLEYICTVLDKYLPPVKGDQVTFIGSTFVRFGEVEPYLNHCIVLNTCMDPKTPNTEIRVCRTEREVLLAWTKLIQDENPDIIIGYNIFGFDYKFLFLRAKELDCLQPFLRLSRNLDEICCQDLRDTNKYMLNETVTKLASGDHELNYINMNGRIQIDLYNYFRKEESLSSYKLDYVAGYFIGGWVDHLDKNISETDISTTSIVYSSNLKGLVTSCYVHFEIIGHTKEYFNNGQKFHVLQINEEDCCFIIQGEVNFIKIMDSTKIRWCLAKDDVTPQDIFRMTNESDESRYLVAKYCLQDCNLLHFLLNKVDVLTSYIEMASICSVPISYLVFRGQGIKLTSYVAKKCREMGILMVVLDKVEDDDGYEGATVLDPKCNLYLDVPVACVDYASLYPSSMISENLSHDSKVWTREYDLENNLVKMTGSMQYDNLPGYNYVDITYDTYKYVRKTPTSHAEKVKNGYKICRFAQYPDGKKAIMPMILSELLKARKDCRQLMKYETDDFMRNVLDKRQLGYKVTANSLYGQCGAKTSTFFDKDIAASTTSTGRSLLIYAKTIIETVYKNRVCSTIKYGEIITNAEYIYGDTDSVFFTFNLETLDGIQIKGEKALEITIELAQEAGHLASQFLKFPHDLEYEKTFMPFCLLSKKKYVGILFEKDITKGKRKEMGIVLKRRDNAPIVKDIYGGIIDILMKEKNIDRAIQFLNMHLESLVNEQCPMEKLIITKSLRSGYKNPNQIAHKVLADRITARDPGNKPNSGDRIPFVYIVNKSKTCLQGDRIETPTYIKENGIKIDYSFYITNQIMNPLQQLFALVLETIWKSSRKFAKLKKFELEMTKLNEEIKKIGSKKVNEKREKLRNNEVKEMLFDPFLRITDNKKVSQSSITKFFKN